MLQGNLINYNGNEELSTGKRKHKKQKEATPSIIYHSLYY